MRKNFQNIQNFFETHVNISGNNYNIMAVKTPQLQEVKDVINFKKSLIINSRSHSFSKISWSDVAHGKYWKFLVTPIV